MSLAPSLLSSLLDSILIPRIPPGHRLTHLFKSRRATQPCFPQLQATFRTSLHSSPSSRPLFILLSNLHTPSGTPEVISIFTSPLVPASEVYEGFRAGCPCPDDCPDLFVFLRREGEAWFLAAPADEVVFGRGDKVCNVPGCESGGGVVPMREGRTMKVCAQCKLVQWVSLPVPVFLAPPIVSFSTETQSFCCSYCSPEHQKSDWKAGHRRVCVKRVPALVKEKP